MLEPAFAALAEVKGPNGNIRTSKFLDACSAVLPIVDKLGTGFMIVKGDINGNITRLRDRAATNPERYEDFFLIVKDDCAELNGKYASSSSVTKGMLWLKRAMQFVSGLIQKMVADKSMTVSQAASTTYKETLSNYHGMITGGAFSMALKLVPARETFLSKLECEDPEAELGRMVTLLVPLLDEIHQFLVSINQDDPGKV
uniref:Glycolipid transfer protein domain-containing protein n=1 Tax=Tetraselmis chuii TaxID=63592 RepID=A0A6U1G441_9CHLO|mmetsp:Transcript_21752/g.38778  ORF Transcript_21752/g.38778 Transcript_21752/m.38778 type:complete len:200 (+) Transcript_21752:159-758(+)|eukprot:CAMPEP_0177759922 /NCGR_PEP_ID=MMETSP0491_2-20121128/4990_1 /TAXON_ID=63592 /ORGANISM="Tetraselmis chuii, Strain PLY429" /LENGTH=199 /DNA_ID=CAMNT_0019275783 /DNA_START=117 /DNA_END=716 /DNA_ORIENTATION=-